MALRNNLFKRRRPVYLTGLMSMLIFIFLLFTVLVVSGCSGDTAASVRAEPEPGKSDLRQQAAPASAFTRYEETPLNCIPTVQPYGVEPDLSNITNKDMFELAPEAQKLLVKNGFVVVPSSYREYFMLYEGNRYQPVPSFVTTDSMLHNYHLYFSHLLRVLETEKLATELEELTTAMLARTREQHAQLKGTGWENAVRRNMGFFAVAGKLLDPTLPVPAATKNEVEKELALIAKHEGVTVSPLMNIGGSHNPANALKEDYSQYIPRGHYEKSQLLQSYFKAMMWYGRLTFRLQSEDETKSAVLITLAMDKDQNRERWDKIYATTNFFVGKSDDITWMEYRRLIDRIYGAGADLQAVISSPDKWETFQAEARKLEPPSINSVPVFLAEINPDRDREINGFRFMGQRYTIDADIFQQLVYREVGANSQGQRRMLPKGLDIPAAMGSAEAYEILDAAGDTDYASYQENMAEIKHYIAGLEKETWTGNLYWGWLYALKPLLEEKGEGYPSFMRNKAWVRKELNTFLGSWTELKHDTILYAKQVYAEMGGGGLADDRGYVEPNPHLYGRLASLVKMTREGLGDRGLLGERERESLERMEQLALYLKDISAPGRMFVR